MSPITVNTQLSIFQLPEEVLLTLFCWLVAVWGDDPPPQYIISSVCRYWRQLVLGHPQLWTSIVVPMRGQYDPLVYFERSASQLFDVTMNSSWVPDPEILMGVSQAILKNIGRLRSLTIDVINFDEIGPLFEAWQNEQAPNFRHLQISCDDSMEAVPEMITHLNQTNTLRSLRLNGLRYQSLPPLPFITTLEIERFSADPPTLHNLFVQFPALETLILGVLSTPTESTDPTWAIEEILAPRLKKMAINLDNDHAESCSCGLPLLNAQNLEYLEISYYGSKYADDYVSLASHFKVSSSLRKLRIRGHLFMNEDFNFLSALPESSCLEIIGFPSHRDPGAGLPIVNLKNLESIVIDLTPTMSKYSSDFDIVAFHNLLQNTRDVEFNCPVAVCCECDEHALASWRLILGNHFSIQRNPLQPGMLDKYIIIYDDFLDRLSGSSQDERYEWGDFDDVDYGDYEDYDGYDEGDDGSYESGIEPEYEET